MPRKLDFSVMVYGILINTGMAFWIFGLPSLVFRIFEVPINCLGTVYYRVRNGHHKKGRGGEGLKINNGFGGKISKVEGGAKFLWGGAKYIFLYTHFTCYLMVATFQVEWSFSSF